MSKFIYSLGIISAGLCLGYTVQVLSSRGLIRLPVELNALRRLLQKAALLAFNPAAVLGAIWSVNAAVPRLAILPFIGLAALAMGAGVAWIGARFLKMPARRAAVYTTSGSFTNIGSIGALSWAPSIPSSSPPAPCCCWPRSAWPFGLGVCSSIGGRPGS